MQIGPVTLEGTHVRLETMRAEHVDQLIAAGTGHGLFRFFPSSYETAERMRAFVGDSLNELAKGTRLPFTTFERVTGKIVGSTSYLAIERAHKRLEIGATWIAPSHQRSAVNTEAKLLQLSHAAKARPRGAERCCRVLGPATLRPAVFWDCDGFLPFALIFCIATRSPCTRARTCRNVVIELEDGSRQRFEGLSSQGGSFSGTGANQGSRVVGVWVKAGNNKSGDGPGYGERFDAPDQDCTPPPVAGNGGSGGSCGSNDPDNVCGGGGLGGAGNGGTPICAEDDPSCSVD